MHTHTHMPCGCVLSNVCGEVRRRVHGYGAVGRQQDEHLRLSGHQVLLSCLNESNLLSALLPSLTKQISFAACSSLLIQLPPAPRWPHHLQGPSFIRAAHCHPLIGIKYHRFSATLTKKQPSPPHRLVFIPPPVQPGGGCWARLKRAAVDQ